MMHAALRASTRAGLPPALLAVLFVLLAMCDRALSQELCKSQEGLSISKPSPPVLLNSALPFCGQYNCSCCDRKADQTLYRSLYAAFTDTGFSRECFAIQRKLTCRVCDPEVGVGLKSTVCLETCNAWYDACKEEFYYFDGPAGAMLPCGETTVGSMLCSRLADLASDGEGLCMAAGLMVARAAPCFNGDTSHRTDFCVKPDLAHSLAAGDILYNAEGNISPAVYFLGVAVVASVVWLSYTTIQGLRAREDEKMRQLHWRQLRGRVE